MKIYSYTGDSKLNKINKLYFLLVEDSPAVLRVLEALISKKGHEFISALDGETALSLIEHNQFNVIITDIGLPGISGIELSLKIRAKEKKYNKQKQIIIGLTGHDQETARLACLNSGINEVFTKPATFAVIDKIIECAVLDKQSKGLSNLVQNHNPHHRSLNMISSNELFNHESYAIFDFAYALQQLNDFKLLLKLINAYLSDESQSDIRRMVQAHNENNWQQVGDLAHKLKAGAIYIGARRLYYACQCLEQYYKSGQTHLLKQLYEQVMVINTETIKVLSSWLRQNNHNAPL